MEKIKAFYSKNYKCIHFALPAVVLEIVLIIMLNLHIGGFFTILSMTVGVICYPWFDFTVYEQTHRYRFVSGVVFSFIIAACVTVGGIAAYYGIIWAMVSLVIPVVLMLFFFTMPNNFRISGVLCPLLFTMGMGVALPVKTMLFMGVLIFLGGVITAIIYFIYYRFFTNLERAKGSFYMTPKEILAHISGQNPRVYRFAIALYITAVLAYLTSNYLSQKFHIFIVEDRSYWAAYFVFAMLQYNNTKEKAYERVWHRFFGTILGILVATPFALFVHSVIILSVVFVIASIILFAISFQKITYLHFAFAANFYVMFLYVLVMKSSSTVLLFRFSETFVAVIWVLIAIAIFWPLLKWLIPLEKWEDKS